MTTDDTTGTRWLPRYEPWRHGGWYVTNVRYPSGAVGCVSRNYPDRKWRIVADDGPSAATYRTRDEAARAELDRSRGTCPKRGRHRAPFCGFCGEHGEPLITSTSGTSSTRRRHSRPAGRARPSPHPTRNGTTSRRLLDLTTTPPNGGAERPAPTRPHGRDPLSSTRVLAPNAAILSGAARRSREAVPGSAGP